MKLASTRSAFSRVEPRNNDFAAETEALASWLQARIAFIQSQLGTLP